MDKSSNLKLNEEQIEASASIHLDDWTSGHLSKTNNFKQELIRKADELAHLVYPLTYKFPQTEKFALGDQIRRAIVSVPTNLIEGIARGGEKEKRQFANIAYGSLKETKYLVYFAYKEGFVKESDYNNLLPKFDGLSKHLFSFLKVLKTV